MCSYCCSCIHYIKFNTCSFKVRQGPQMNILLWWYLICGVGCITICILDTNILYVVQEYYLDISCLDLTVAM